MVFLTRGGVSEYQGWHMFQSETMLTSNQICNPKGPDSRGNIMKISKFLLPDEFTYS